MYINSARTADSERISQQVKDFLDSGKNIKTFGQGETGVKVVSYKEKQKLHRSKQEKKCQ
ncbi:MAG: hypothetical protein RPR91_03175 [Colwellia sp.]